jgi:hypothetical protein
MLMLIDTPDPRYRRDPDPEPEPDRGRNPRLRVCAPIVASIVAFAGAYVAPPFVTFLLTVVGLLLFFDGVLAMLPTGDGLWNHRQ